MERNLEIFKALSDKTRLRLLRLIIVSKKSICVCELSDALELPQYNISRHLKILKNAGLINEERIGRWKYYSLTDEKNAFNENLFQTVSSILNETVDNDYKKLITRLKMRIKGKCVSGT